MSDQLNEAARLSHENWLREKRAERGAIFQRRHYEAIAEVLRKSRSDNYPEGDKWVEICQQMSLMFAEDNPNFNLEKFLRACASA